MSILLDLNSTWTLLIISASRRKVVIYFQLVQLNIYTTEVWILFPYFSWCSFSMMVKWANDGLPQANDGKMLVNDGEMLVNDGEMSVWYTHFTIIDEHSPSLTSILPSLAWSKPSFTHLTIIEKLHQLMCKFKTKVCHWI